MDKEEHVGYLTVRVTTARGAIPLEMATVAVRGSEPKDSGVQGVYRTGRDGLTQKIPLKVPPRENSQAYGLEDPFYTYTIEVTAKGYASQFYYNVPAFEGISAMQTAELVPLQLNGMPDRFNYNGGRYFERENPDL